MATVETLSGEVDVNDLGVTYMHEHVLIMTPEAQRHWPGYNGWQEDMQVEAARAELRRLSLLRPRAPA